VSNAEGTPARPEPPEAREAARPDPARGVSRPVPSPLDTRSHQGGGRFNRPAHRRTRAPRPRRGQARRYLHGGGAGVSRVVWGWRRAESQTCPLPTRPGARPAPAAPRGTGAAPPLPHGTAPAGLRAHIRARHPAAPLTRPGVGGTRSQRRRRGGSRSSTASSAGVLALSTSGSASPGVVLRACHVPAPPHHTEPYAGFTPESTSRASSSLLHVVNTIGMIYKNVTEFTWGVANLVASGEKA
jgi:hypothetical protein